MDTKSFVRILRKVIREEVGKAVKQALNETVVTDKQVINNGVNLHELVDTPKPVKRQFVKNSMLNDILNDTAYESDFSGMNEGAQYAPNFSDMGSMRPSTAVQSMTGINGEHVDTTKPEMQAVGKALTRDYSGLMKAINKKKGIS
tara:strand:+ start:51 stop:485 length:435 start_codon:yes stop_codon:yes gene_type:complete